MNINIKEELAIIEEYNHHLDAIRNLSSLLVNKLKEKEQIIIHLTDELIVSKNEISELNKEVRSLMGHFEDKIKCLEEERHQLINENNQLQKQVYEQQYQQQQELYAATTCCNDNYDDFRMSKVRPIDRNGNMKKII